jgi:hypothetical protein
MLEHLFDAELIYRSEMARRSDEASRIWAVAATLRFESEHERYQWLDNALGVWEGEFDAEAHTARYQAYVVKDDAGEARR